MDCDDLAKRLGVGLGSPDICLPRRGEVAHILQAQPTRRRDETRFVAAHARSTRRWVSRTAVRRLARKLEEETRRATEAAVD